MPGGAPRVLLPALGPRFPQQQGKGACPSWPETLEFRKPFTVGKVAGTWGVPATWSEICRDEWPSADRSNHRASDGNGWGHGFLPNPELAGA